MILSSATLETHEDFEAVLDRYFAHRPLTPARFEAELDRALDGIVERLDRIRAIA
jgi:hypothetical protein